MFTWTQARRGRDRAAFGGPVRQDASADPGRWDEGVMLGSVTYWTVRSKEWVLVYRANHSLGTVDMP
jgi:hypothetical protein